MSTNYTTYSEVYEDVVDLTNDVFLTLPTKATSIDILSLAVADGINGIQASVQNDAAIVSTITAGAAKLTASSLPAANIFLGSRKVAGSFSVTNNILSFTPTANVSIMKDAAVSCYLTATPVAAGTAIDKAIRYSNTTLHNSKTAIDLGVVSGSANGSATDGYIVIHDAYAGLAYPQSTKFKVISKANNQVVLRLNAPLLAAEKALLEKGSLELRLIYEKSMTGVSAVPKAKSANLSVDVVSVDPSAMTITVNDFDNYIGDVNAIGTGVLYAQGGFTLAPSPAAYAGADIYSPNTLFLAKGAVQAGLARIRIICGIALKSI